MSLKYIQEHTNTLLEVLNNLLNVEDKSSIPVNIVDCTYHYVVHFIPSNFQHPLKDIVNSVKKPFFLVSKLPDTLPQFQDDSTDEEEEERPKLLPEVAVITKQHVFVGTPISHQVSYLFWQKNFHNSEMVITKKYLDTSKLQKLELKDARYLASIYVQCVKRQKDLPEMWLLCDHGSPQGVDYMGVVPVISDDQKQPQQISTVMIRREDYGEKKPGSSLGDKKKQHVNFHRTNQSETHGYARYNVYGTLDSHDGELDESQSGISMEFAWDGVREILQPPPSSSNAVLNIIAHPEDVQAILPGITNELNTLGKLFGKFQTKIQEESDGEIEQNGSDEEFDEPELKKTILEFLDKLRLQSMGQSNKVDPSVSSPSAAIPFDTTEHLKRQDLDNTESLWVFLKDLPSTAQMIFCLDVILQQLFSGEYQPVLYANNQTQIAILMKEVISCSTDKERAEINRKISNVLTPTAALQGIVDIGIHKLQNDYINFFIKQELVTKDLLEYFVTKDASSSEKLQRLLKLHCILSLVTLATSYARINHDDLRQLVPATLKFYENHSHTEIPLFSLSLPAFSTSSSKVKNTCVRQFQPQTWVAAITTTNQYITMVQLDAKEPSESFVEESSTLRANSYSITTASTHKVCIPN